jgi:hypothetical protein
MVYLFRYIFFLTLLSSKYTLRAFRSAAPNFIGHNNGAQAWQSKWFQHISGDAQAGRSLSIQYTV